MMSTHAQAAAAIRQELKAAGLKIDSVRSKVFAGGDSVVVLMTDASPDDYERACRIAAPYQYGHYDDLDNYRADNLNPQMAQVKHVIVENGPSDAMLQRIQAYALFELDASDTNDGQRIGFNFEHQIFNGTLGDFWEVSEALPEPQPTPQMQHQAGPVAAADPLADALHFAEPDADHTLCGRSLDGGDVDFITEEDGYINCPACIITALRGPNPQPDVAGMIRGIADVLTAAPSHADWVMTSESLAEIAVTAEAAGTEEGDALVELLDGVANLIADAHPECRRYDGDVAPVGIDPAAGIIPRCLGCGYYGDVTPVGIDPDVVDATVELPAGWEWSETAYLGRNVERAYPNGWYGLVTWSGEEVGYRWYLGAYWVLSRMPCRAGAEL